MIEDLLAFRIEDRKDMCHVTPEEGYGHPGLAFAACLFGISHHGLASGSRLEVRAHLAGGCISHGSLDRLIELD